MISQEILTTLPDAPGVYFFKKGTDILYIGKATSLRDRVKSYLNRDIAFSRGPKIVKMLSLANRVDFETTDSVLEALILESNLIKEHQPEYNTREKDDKSYNYVVVTKEDFPRIFTVRERELLQRGIGKTLGDITLKYVFGPFPHGMQLREALKIIRKIFPFRDKKSTQRSQELFYQMIGLSPDTHSDEAKKEYAKTIDNIKLFFEGKKTRLVKSLEKQMHDYAKKLEFERAERVKRQIFALKHIQDISLIKEDLKVDSKRTFRIEAYDVAHMGGTDTVGVMTVIQDGEVAKHEYKKFKIRNSVAGSDTHALREILERRFNHPEWRYPNIVVVDGGIAQKRVAESVMHAYGIEIPIVAVTKDERHRPKDLKGRGEIIREHDKAILLANAEAHRFAVSYHKTVRGKNLFGK